MGTPHYLQGKGKRWSDWEEKLENPYQPTLSLGELRMTKVKVMGSAGQKADSKQLELANTLAVLSLALGTLLLQGPPRPLDWMPRGSGLRQTALAGKMKEGSLSIVSE